MDECSTDAGAIDPFTAEVLLGGAPGGPGTIELDAFPLVASLLAALVHEPGPRELAGEGDILAMFRRERSAIRERSRRRSPFVRRVAALAVVSVALVGGTAAAATSGSLPAPVQGAAHEALAVFGLTVPHTAPDTVPDTTLPPVPTDVPAPSTETSAPGATGAISVPPTEVPVDDPSHPGADGAATCSAASDGRCDQGQARADDVTPSSAAPPQAHGGQAGGSPDARPTSPPTTPAPPSAPTHPSTGKPASTPTPPTSKPTAATPRSVQPSSASGRR